MAMIIAILIRRWALRVKKSRIGGSSLATTIQNIPLSIVGHDESVMKP